MAYACICHFFCVPLHPQNGFLMINATTILLVILTITVVIFGFWFIQYSQFRNEEKKRQFELKRESQKTISPIRLRAYERLALLLERTTPAQMLIGLDLSQMTIPQLQQHLLQTIRAEFEHNMSQQIYVSDEVWALIMNARDQMAAFVIGIASQLPPDANAQTYATTMLQAYNSNGQTPSDRALEELRNEAKGLL